tara:strand:+ start:101 stop:319 length:219 start_codon:yes stop_codon:yes gene_type:complete
MHTGARREARQKAKKAAFERDKFMKREMTLTPRNRDMLLSRINIGIAYSAVWGFGGSCNCRCVCNVRVSPVL